MSTVDLLKSAQTREYMAFEDKALEMLKAKVQENPIMREKLAKLNVAQGLAEAEEEEREEEREEEGEEEEIKEEEEDDE